MDSNARSKHGISTSMPTEVVRQKGQVCVHRMWRVDPGRRVLFSMAAHMFSMPISSRFSRHEHFSNHKEHPIFVIMDATPVLEPGFHASYTSAPYVFGLSFYQILMELVVYHSEPLQLVSMMHATSIFLVSPLMDVYVKTCACMYSLTTLIAPVPESSLPSSCAILHAHTLYAII